MLERLFQLQARGTTPSTEITAGVTTFMTMAYILAVNPNILATTGMSRDAVFFATCVGAALVTIAMGLYVNYPVALAPGMGLNAYFAVVASPNGGIPWEVALGAVFLSGVIFVILTVTQIRQLLVVAVPNSLKKAITVGIGLFITIIGLKLSHLTIVSLHLGPSFDQIAETRGFGNLLHFEWDITMGALTQPDTLLALIGLTITAGLMALKLRGSLLIGIVATTLIGIPLGVTNLGDFTFAWPAFDDLAVGSMDVWGAIEMGIIAVILTFTFVELFDTFGTLVGTANKAGLLDEKGNSPQLGKAMMVDAGGVSLGAFLGTSAITAYVESAAGISEGGRTGLTAVITGILFLFALVLAPFFRIIPDAATAPALIIVGVLMISVVRDIDFNDFTEALPAFLTLSLMPFTYNIANGIAAGIVFYTFLKVFTGKARDVHWLMYAITVLIVWRYATLGAGH
ncbi:NCS2 family permease [Heliorestis convoluta]|uniref:Xanthine/uracil/vitamin C permease n=1 Tax=Heliorestis convoluta TaxID=356322 RepID=A0A5Q2N1P6_9FIRM|nr:NCS2 family permease [Heliorestis convoluta]QGG46280.1 Xanthine/uracil/vitamin C permease [Heliorestis convoluta]